MMKKLASILLAILMVALMSSAAMATDDDTVAMIGSERYTSLEAAIEAYTGGEVALYKDVTIANRITIAKDLVLNGNDHTITYTGSDRVIDAPKQDADDNPITTNLTIKNLKIRFDGYSERGISFNNGGTLTLNDVDIDGESTTYGVNFPSASNNATVMIDGCTIKGNTALNIWGANMNVTVKNSKLHSYDRNDAETYMVIGLCSDGTISAENTTVTVTDTTLTAEGESAAVGNNTLTGEVILDDSCSYDAPIRNAVAVATYEGSNYFYSHANLATLLKTADETDADCVKLLRDVEDIGNVTVPADITFDGNGKTISGNSALYVEAAGGVTIKNTNFKNITNGKDLSAIYAIDLTGTLEITDCTFEAIEYDGMQITPKATANIVVKNNTFNGNSYRYIHIQNTTGKAVAYSATITGNKLNGTTTNGSIECDYFANEDKIKISDNYVADLANVCLLKGYADSFTNMYELVFPLADTQPTYAAIVKNTYGAEVYEYDEIAKAVEDGEAMRVNDTVMPYGYCVDGNNIIHKAAAALENGTCYATIQEAVNAAGGGEVVTILDNVETDVVYIEKTVTLNLNGYTISPAKNFSLVNGGVFIVRHGGALTIDDQNSRGATGTIKAQGNGQNVYCAVLMTKGDDTKTDEAQLTVRGGKLIGSYYGISGNGNPGRDNTEITIMGGEVTVDKTVSGGNGVGIYQPQVGTLTIQNGTVSGDTGIEVRAGTLKINGGTISSWGSELVPDYSGDGPSVSGAAVAVSQHTTNKAIDVYIRNGKLESKACALYQGVHNGTNASQKVSILVEGNATFDGPVTVTESNVMIARAGRYQEKFDTGVITIPEGMELKKESDGYYHIASSYRPIFAIIRTTTEGAVIEFKDASGNVMTPDSDGDYEIFAGQTYSYTVSCEGYVTYEDTFTAVEGVEYEKTVTLEAVVDAEAPTITAQPQPANYKIGDTAAALSVTATVADNGTLSYQWYVITADGATKIDGATASTYTPDISAEGVKSYYCVVTNTNTAATGMQTAMTDSGKAEISVVKADVVNAKLPNITVHPASAVYENGEAIKALSVTAESIDGGVLSYRWFEAAANNYDAGYEIAGVTESTYTPVMGAGTKYYFCVVTNTNDKVNGEKAVSLVTEVAEITVKPGAGQHKANITINGNKAGLKYTNVSAYLMMLDGNEPMYMHKDMQQVPDSNPVQYEYNQVAEDAQYNLIITATEVESGKEVTMTTLVDLRGHDDLHAVTLPDVQKSSVVEGTEETGIIVGGVEEVAADQKVAVVGGHLEVQLQIEEEKKVDSEDKAAITEKAAEGGATVEQIVNIDLILKQFDAADKQVGEDQDLGDKNNQLLKILIPFELGDRKPENVVMLRMHNDVVEALRQIPATSSKVTDECFIVYEDHIELYAKKFSAYAIAYNKGDKAVISDPTEAKTVTVLAGDTATMTVTAQNAKSYQWQINRNDGKGWINCGENKPVHITSATTVADNGYLYKCIVTGTDDKAVESPVFTLEVITPVVLPETGDNANMALWLALLGMSVLALCGAALKRRVN